MRHDPSAYGATARSTDTGRISSLRRDTRADLESVATKSLDGGGGGMPWRQRNDDDLAAALANFARAHDGRLSIVSSLYQDVRTQRVDQFAWRVLVEDDDGVYRLQRGKNVAAL